MIGSKLNKIGVSLCIPSYGRPELLKRTLISIVRQTKKPYEVIVMDDASPMDMSDIKKICLENGFKYIENKRNMGLMENFKNVLIRATGSHLALVHNDDLLSRYYIEEIEGFIKKYPNYNVYVTNGIGIDEKEKVISEFRVFRKDTVIKKKHGIKNLWARDYLGLLTVIGSTVYTREFFQRNPLDVSLGNEADAYNMLLMLKEENIMYVDKSVYFTTLHKDQVSYKNKRSDEMLRVYIRSRLEIFKKFEKDFEEVPFYLSKIKTLHFLQLFLKYKYGVKQIREMLEIKTTKELLTIMMLTPVLTFHTLCKRAGFLIHQKSIQRYFHV